MALVDRAMRWAERGEDDVGAPAQHEEFVLSHCDDIQGDPLPRAHKAAAPRRLSGGAGTGAPPPTRGRGGTDGGGTTEAPECDFACLDERTKRMIRRALLKAVAIPGCRVPFASR